MKKLIIFGLTDTAELANYYFSNDSDFKVEAFCADKDYINEKKFCDLEVHDFNKIEELFNPSDYFIFIAISYKNMNQVRQKKLQEAKEKGFKIASYISSKASILNRNKIGENCFILEDNTIQPFVRIGNNVTLWSGNHIGHHTEIGDNTFISSQVVISGRCKIGENCFFGVNSTVNNEINIADFSLISSSSLINKDTKENGIYIGSPARIKEGIKSTEIDIK